MAAGHPDSSLLLYLDAEGIRVPGNINNCCFHAFWIASSSVSSGPELTMAAEMLARRGDASRETAVVLIRDAMAHYSGASDAMPLRPQDLTDVSWKRGTVSLAVTT